MDEQFHMHKDSKEAGINLFSFVYVKYYRPVVNYISRLLMNRQTGEDIAQEVFLKLLQNINSLHPHKLKGWLYTVAHHEVINYIRKKSIYTSSLNELISELPSQEIVSQALETQHYRELIRNTFLKIPKKQAAAIYLRDVQDMSYSQIAEKLEISYEAVKSLIFRGRQNFIKCYKELNRDEL